MFREQAPAVLVKVQSAEYLRALNRAQWADQRIAVSTSAPRDIALIAAKEYHRLRNMERCGWDYPSAIAEFDAWFNANACHYRLAKSGNDVVGGFVVVGGQLLGLWAPKRGDWAVRDAISLGATNLDCFDGFLPTFYARHGFKEVLREPNWQKGCPDIVFMRRVG